MKSVLSAPMNPIELKAAPRQGQSKIMTRSIKIVLWTWALFLLAIVMMIWLIPVDPSINPLEIP